MGYEFRWELPEEDDGADSGMKVSLVLYKLIRCTLQEVLEEKYSRKAANTVFYTAGKLAGARFYARYIEPVSGLDKFISKTEKLLIKEKLGVFRIEEDPLKQGTVLLTIDEMDVMDEDLYGFGPLKLDDKSSIYDEGFFSALFEQFIRKKWQTKEIDCWCTGARTQRILLLRKIK